MKVCALDGCSKFLPKYHPNNQKFCSKECATKNKKIRSRHWHIKNNHPPPQLSQRECKTCYSIFQPKSQQNIYCSNDCRKKAGVIAKNIKRRASGGKGKRSGSRQIDEREFHERKMQEDRKNHRKIGNFYLFDMPKPNLRTDGYANPPRTDGNYIYYLEG